MNVNDCRKRIVINADQLFIIHSRILRFELYEFKSYREIVIYRSDNYLDSSYMNLIRKVSYLFIAQIIT